MSLSSRIQWGALFYELKRIAFPRLYKLDRSDREWCPPVLTTLGYACAMFCLMLFLGIYLYWDAPAVLIAVAGGPILIARNIWAERNPLLRDRPADFMAACGYTIETWYRASLLTGLLLSLGFGSLLAAGMAWLYRTDVTMQPVDRDVVLEIAALPMATALFYLLHLSFEQKRRLRSIREPGEAPSLVERIRIFGGLEKLLWVPHLFFFGLLILIFVRPSVVELVLVGLWLFTLVAAIAAARARWVMSSIHHVQTASILAAFALYGTTFYVVEHVGTDLFPPILAGLMDKIRAPAATVILIVLFLTAARKALRLPVENTLTHPLEPAAAKEEVA